jgi:hypothetical protein
LTADAAWKGTGWKRREVVPREVDVHARWKREREAEDKRRRRRIRRRRRGGGGGRRERRRGRRGRQSRRSEAA